MIDRKLLWSLVGLAFFALVMMLAAARLLTPQGQPAKLVAVGTSWEPDDEVIREWPAVFKTEDGRKVVVLVPPDFVMGEPTTTVYYVYQDNGVWRVRK